MKKTYKIDVDCANCANKMEDAAKKTPGVKDATVNFMTLKMIVEFDEGLDPARFVNAFSDFFACFAFFDGAELAVFYTRHIHLYIDPVHQRAGNPAPVRGI